MLEAMDRIDRLERRLDRALRPEATKPSASLIDLGLLDFIPAVSRRFEAPRHLAPLVELIERAQCEPVRVVVSTPPRHGKTETLLHAIPWILLRNPARQIAYISYAHRFAEKKSRKARELAKAAGVPLADDAQSRADWRTGVDDGGVWATSVGGSLTGEGFHFAIVDDPVKDRAKAESSLEREKMYEWFNDTMFTRLEPNGSAIVNMARWHEDDLAGQLIKDGWQELRLPAISDEGAALWPGRWPLERLQEIQEQLGDYGWSSLYQGQPRTRGASVFDDVRFYDALPASYRVGVGLDLAYSAKTHADWSVAVVVAEHDGIFYVLNVVRMQATPPAFATKLKPLRAAHQGARWLWYTSTTEMGLADLLREGLGFPVMGEIAKADKFVRAQPVAAAWKAGKVLVPHNAPWLEAFVSEVAAFTGVNDRHDDQVDALAAAFDVLTRGQLGRLAAPKPPIKQRTGFTDHNLGGGGFHW